MFYTWPSGLGDSFCDYDNMTTKQEKLKDLAKEIHNDAHKQYLHESKSVKADITAPGGWLEDELIQINEELNKWYPSKKDSSK